MIFIKFLFDSESNSCIRILSFLCIHPLLSEICITIRYFSVLIQLVDNLQHISFIFIYIEIGIYLVFISK